MSDRPRRLRFGVFIAPFHRIGENPSLALKRNMELIQHCDELGYDEAWVGEHHSFARELISNPMIFMAEAAARTRDIKLGTGVVSLPYHHPLMIADDFLQLDHMTRGRAMLGVGPGALTSDAVMMGIDPESQRRRMGESLQAIMRLFNGETVTMQTDWFELNEARLQMGFYSDPAPEVAVAVMRTPAGPQLAGKYGVGLLSLAGFESDNVLQRVWAWAEESAEEHAQAVARTQWRTVVAVHLADTREEAIADVSEGYRQRPYVGDAGSANSAKRAGGGLFGGATTIEEAIELDAVIVGSPQDAVASIQRLQDRSGGLGGILVHAHEWANLAQTNRSYELLMRFVAPHFQGQLGPLIASRDHVESRQLDIFGAAGRALARAYLDAGKDVPSELSDALETAEPAGADGHTNA